VVAPIRSSPVLAERHRDNQKAFRDSCGTNNITRHEVVRKQEHCDDINQERRKAGNKRTISNRLNPFLSSCLPDSQVLSLNCFRDHWLLLFSPLEIDYYSRG